MELAERNKPSFSLNLLIIGSRVPHFRRKFWGENPRLPERIALFPGLQTSVPPGQVFPRTFVPLNNYPYLDVRLAPELGGGTVGHTHENRHISEKNID